MTCLKHHVVHSEDLMQHTVASEDIFAIIKVVWVVARTQLVDRKRKDLSCISNLTGTVGGGRPPELTHEIQETR